MQGGLGKRAALLGVGLAAWAALGGIGPALAQAGPCAAEDLACRVAALERRLDELAARPAPAPAPAAAPIPSATMFDLSRRCATNCAAEAASFCADRGFAGGGSPEEWRRDRGGAVTLTRVVCVR